jgi:L-iditol 2-dehydrogenase
MRALVFTGIDAPAIREVSVPAIGPDDVLVRSQRVGICHSDFELLEGRYIIPFSYPIIPGHEWAGVVEDIGSAVTDLHPGDRVVGECVVGPGGRDHFGFSIDGGAAEYVRVRGEWLHRIPDSLSWTQAALVEPFSVAYNATRALGGVDPSDTVAVLGAGPIGLLSVAAAAACNARVIIVEPRPERRALARELGAAAELDPADGSFEDGVAEVTDGRGFDAVIEAAGAPAAMAQALRIVGHTGRIAYVGINVGSTVPSALGLIQSKSLRLQGMIGSPGVWPEAIRVLASGAVDVARIVSATVPLGDALDALSAARDAATNIKVHIGTDA